MSFSVQPRTSAAGLLYHHLNTTYQSVVNIVQKNQIELSIPEEPTSKQKISFFEKVVEELLSNGGNVKQVEKIEKCEECLYYEEYIDKLQNNLKDHMKIHECDKMDIQKNEERIMELMKSNEEKDSDLINKKEELKRKYNEVYHLEEQLSSSDKEKNQLERKNNQLKEEILQLKGRSQLQLNKITENLKISYHHQDSYCTNKANKQNKVEFTSRPSLQFLHELKPEEKTSRKGISLKYKPYENGTGRIIETKVNPKK